MMHETIDVIICSGIDVYLICIDIDVHLLCDNMDVNFYN